MLAVSSEKPVKTCRLLLERDADPNATNNVGKSPLHYVVQCCRSEPAAVASLLIDAGAQSLGSRL